MGAECSFERDNNFNSESNGADNNKNKNGEKINSNISNENILPIFVEIKNYKEYNYKMETMKRKILDKLERFKKSKKLSDYNLINKYYI
jgi:hypothetical protein